MTTSLALTESYCRDCGSVIKAQAEICPKCGVRQKQPVLATARNRTTAALFAFFLGGIGAHRFYLGQAGLGILYLLFCWTLVPAFIGLIEGIVYLSMSDTSFNARYNIA
jgi:TM2 domain-containing membrane protein YozV